jgi:ubiquinone/menaquinone biosynthesis C-methylase UbiE
MRKWFPELGPNDCSGGRSHVIIPIASRYLWPWLGLALLLLIVSLGAIAPAQAKESPAPIYQQRTLHDPDGIGKFYMGREIAQVMGHQGAGWLERSSRQAEEKPQVLVEALDLRSTDTVADIGAGTGYMSLRMAPRVPQGQVLAVDVQPEMIEILTYLKQERKSSNVEPVLGSTTNPNLPPKQVDLAIMVDAYHEFEYPREMMTAIVQALKPGGRVVLVEYRAENPLIMIKRLHKMTQAQVKKEMQAVGLVWQKTDGRLPQQHIMIFRKPA